MKTRLAAHEYPREVDFVPELPLTTTGKILRRELRRREAERGDVVRLRLGQERLDAFSKAVQEGGEADQGRRPP